MHYLMYFLEAITSKIYQLHAHVNSSPESSRIWRRREPQFAAVSYVIERRTSTKGELFSLLKCPDATKFVLLSFFALIQTIF